MADHGPKQPIDVVRKLVIIGVLLAGILLMYRYATPTDNPIDTVLLTIGFVVLASYTIGEVVEVVKLPHITGYLLAGILLGSSLVHTLAAQFPGVTGYLLAPFDHGLLNESMVGIGGELSLLDDLALALICMTAGGELKVAALKSGFGRILAMLGAQTLAMYVGVILMFLAVSGRVSFLPTFSAIEGLDLVPTIALGAVLASVCLATSPAATIAIINSTGAKGPLTSDVLPVVVLKDVVVVIGFSATSVIAIGLLPGAEPGASFGSALAVIAGSAVLGAIVGGAVHLYLKYIGAEMTIFVVGMVFATTQLAGIATHWWDPKAHAELALVFIALGFVVSNWSSKGDDLIHEVERIAGPVYVLFFTMAGAKLHLDLLVANGVLAVILVATRVGMLFLGVTFAAKATRAHLSTQRYGWMGFVSQAGLSLTLAAAIQKIFGGDVGQGLFALILAGTALNEILGPVLLQMGLTMAGETAEQRGVEDGSVEDDLEERQATEEALAPWRREANDVDVWGPPAASGSDRVDRVIGDLELDLRQLVKGLDQGPLPQLEDSARKYVRTLRQDFLRFHRHLVTHGDEDPEVLLGHARTEMAELSARWRDSLLGRAAVVSQPGWSPRTLQTAVDLRVRGLPAPMPAPLLEPSLELRAESGFRRLQRRWLRLRHRVSPVQRELDLLAIGRFHFEGRGAARMEGLAAMVINAELHLANRTQALFTAIEAAVARLTIEIRKHPENRQATIEALRQEIEEDFRLALEEVGWMVSDCMLRATAIVGGALKHVKHDLLVFDTMDLPARRRRFNIVYDERTRGLTALEDGLDAARKTAGSRLAALALAFEVVRLEIRVTEAVETHGERLVRQIRGKGLKQVDRIDHGLYELIQKADLLLDEPTLTGVALAAQLREATLPVVKIAKEAIENTTLLRDWLAGDASDEPLLEAIVGAAQGLTEVYDVPTSAPVVGEWALPSPVATTEVPFREVTLSFIDANITRDLVDVTRRTAVLVDGLLHELQRMETVLQFNLEFAENELVDHEAPPAEEVRELVREMVIGSWSRNLESLRQSARAASVWPDEAVSGIREAVLGELDDFREQVLDGRITTLLSVMMREVRARGRLLSTQGVTELVGRSSVAASEAMTRALGHERIANLRHQLGLRDVKEVAHPEAFSAPATMERLPAVYRRLFSEHALEAGDLLTGRDEEYALALAALREEGAGRYRTVALVSMDGIAKRALANALVRGLGASQVRRMVLTAPVDVATVESWFSEHGGLLVIDGVCHLFENRSGGFEPLKRFLAGIVRDAGRTAILLLAENAVWSHAKVAARMGDFIAHEVVLRRLTAEELERALVARHGMSGYHLHYQPGDDITWQLADLLSRTDDVEQRHQQTWFATLYRASDGVMQDALRLWMASIVDIDAEGGVVHLGQVPQPPVSRLRRLPDPTLLTLKNVLHQGTSSVVSHASAFRITDQAAHLELASLAHAGLLDDEKGHYEIPEHLRAALYTVLSARGWV